MNTYTQTTEVNSLKYVMAKWAEILETEKEMSQFVSGNDDKYYSLQDKLKRQLVEFCRLNFSYLNTRQLLRLCDLVQSHRPIALHSFLIKCGNL